jgi:serine/threonine-protein kinase
MEKSESSQLILNNRYQITQTLGSGGMAVVYRAKDLMLERPVAIKLLRQDFSENKGFRERFHQEAKAAANLSHPNIVTIHDFGYDQDRLYIVMEYVPGKDLKSILNARGPLSLDEAIPLLVQACAGIGYAHRAGIVHCDIKPHNMLVTPDLRLKVADFGIARALASIHPDERNDVVWGSPQYISPEQSSGAAPSPASDVYSLGVLMYEMLTGKLPFFSTDPAELSRLHRDATPVPPSKLNPEIPVELEQIILKVLSKEPSARYRTADQLGRVLLSFGDVSEQYISNLPGNYHTSNANTQNSHLPIKAISPETLPYPDQISQKTHGTDWSTIGLSLLAILSVGGLIPFWIYVWFSLNPPIR